ncbi:MAG: protein-L-isoaspartate O-methyltransferase [Candidatus Altiarchaeota archaeon]
MGEKVAAILVVFVLIVVSAFVLERGKPALNAPLVGDDSYETVFSESPEYKVLRKKMVEDIKAKGVSDPEVLLVIGKTPLHVFVLEKVRTQAYSGFPLAIGRNRTMQQAYYTAYVAETVKPSAEDRVLEVGAGTGYQTAVLASLAGEVYAVESEREFTEAIRDNLETLGIGNVRVREADPSRGWEENAPYDIIVVNLGVKDIPPHLTEQLAGEGRIIAPLIEDGAYQRLTLIDKANGTTKTARLEMVRFDLM